LPEKSIVADSAFAITISDPGDNLDLNPEYAHLGMGKTAKTQSGWVGTHPPDYTAKPLNRTFHSRLCRQPHPEQRSLCHIRRISPGPS